MKLFLLGGTALSMANFRGPLIRDMSKTGVQVFAGAPGYDDQLSRRVREFGAVPIECRLSRKGLNPVANVRDAAKLLKTVRSVEPDMLLTYFIKPIMYGGFAARFSGLRHVVLLEGLGRNFSPNAEADAFLCRCKRTLLRTLIRGLLRPALGRAEHVFVLNSDDRSFLLHNKLAPAGKTTRLDGIGVDLAHFHPVARRRPESSFLFIGRLIREKGIEVFMEAAVGLKKRYPRVRFIVLGGEDGGESKDIAARLRKMTAAGILEWMGRVEDVRPWIADCCALVLPSYYREGLPRSIMEAMAMARPVITTDAPGCREAVDHGLTGLVVGQQDVDGLMRSMEQYVQNPGLSGSMGIQARAVAEKRFDVSRTNRIILQTLGISCP